MAAVVGLGELLVDLVPAVTPTTLADAPACEKAAGGAVGSLLPWLRPTARGAMLAPPRREAVGRFLAASHGQLG